MTPTRFATTPFLLALFAAVAAQPTNVFQICKWNVGTLEIEPWRTRAAAALTSARRALSRVLSPHLAIAAILLLLACLLLAPHAAAAHHGTPLLVAGVVGNVTDLQRKLRDVQTRGRELLDRTMARTKAEGRVMTATEKADIQELLAEGTALKERLDMARGDSAFAASFENLTGDMGRSDGRGVRANSVGQRFIDSPTGRDLIRQHRAGIPATSWTSVSSEIELHATTLTEDGGSGGQLIVPQYVPGIVPLPTRRLVIADLFAPGETGSNAVGFMKETTFTNAAATVAEAGTKPESTLVFAAESEAVRKIAHWLPVTEEILEDVPAMRSYIDARLELGVQLKEDDSVLNGTDVAPDLNGILVRAGLAAAVARGADSNADAVIRQIAAIENATNLPVDGIVMNPTNWLSIQLMKDANGNYINGNPFAAPQRPTLWGRPVALTPAIAAGTALVGAFKAGGQIFRKGGLRVEASNSHASFFVNNLVAIRAEERLALVIYRESAFGTVTGLE